MEAEKKGAYRSIELLEQQMKEGRVLSGKNENDLRDAVDQHNQGIDLINGVLKQVTGTANAGDNPNPSPSAGDATPASGTNAYRQRTYERATDDDVVVVDSEDLAEVIHAKRTGITDTAAEKRERARRI